MNIHFILFFCFLSALCGGHSGLVSAKLDIFAGAEGGNGTINCYLSKSGSRKFFCKDECKAEDILIKTDEVRAQSGRYSTEYRDDSSGKGVVSVTITHLTKSDSGRYRCGLGGNLVPDSYWDYEVRVVDEATLDVSSRFSSADVEGENITFGCLDTVNGKQKFLCKNKCEKEEDILIETDENRAQNGRYSIEYREGSVFGLYVTITQATKSDSGWYKCGYGRASSPESSYTNKVLVIEAATTSNPHWTPRPSTSVPSTSTPTTTLSFISTSGSFTPSTPFPATAGHFTAVTTSNPNRTPRPSTSVPSASTTTQSFSSAATTSNPHWTPRPSTSVPSTSTPATTQSFSSSSGSNQFTAVSCAPHTGYILPLIVCVFLVVTLLVIALTLLYTWKKKRLFTINSRSMEVLVSYKNLTPASTCEDSTSKANRD